MKPVRLRIGTSQRCELVDVTEAAREAARAFGGDGALLLYCPHTTAGVTIQENADPDVRHDLLLALAAAVPEAAARGRYRHVEGNSDAHVKASLVGASALVPVAGGELQLGTWQGLYLCEFDGPRQRELVATFLRSA